MEFRVVRVEHEVGTSAGEERGSGKVKAADIGKAGELDLRKRAGERAQLQGGLVGNAGLEEVINTGCH